MSTRIFVGILAPGTANDLFQLFRKHGGLQSLSLPVDPAVGDGKEFALIEMSHEWEARAAMAALNKTQVLGPGDCSPRSQKSGVSSFRGLIYFEKLIELCAAATAECLQATTMYQWPKGDPNRRQVHPSRVRKPLEQRKNHLFNKRNRPARRQGRRACVKRPSAAGPNWIDK